MKTIKKFKFEIIILIIISCIILFLCVLSQKNKKSEIVDNYIAEIPKISKEIVNDSQEKLIPKEKNVEVFEKLIPEKEIEITIKKFYLDSYVVYKFKSVEDGKDTFSHAYRDAEILVVIKHKSQVVFDKIFRKEDFGLSKEFLNESIFYSYEFSKIDKNKIQFKISIGPAETDVGVFYEHYFDIESKKMELVVERVYDESNF